MKKDIIAIVFVYIFVSFLTMLFMLSDDVNMNSFNYFYIFVNNVELLIAIICIILRIVEEKK